MAADVGGEKPHVPHPIQAGGHGGGREDRASATELPERSTWTNGRAGERSGVRGRGRRRAVAIYRGSVRQRVDGGGQSQTWGPTGKKRRTSRMEATRDGGSDDDPGRQRRPRTAVATGWRRTPDGGLDDDGEPLRWGAVASNILFRRKDAEDVGVGGGGRAVCGGGCAGEKKKADHIFVSPPFFSL
jgi:hypothetical protein